MTERWMSGLAVGISGCEWKPTLMNPSPSVGLGSLSGVGVAVSMPNARIIIFQAVRKVPAPLIASWSAAIRLIGFRQIIAPKDYPNITDFIPAKISESGHAILTLAPTALLPLSTEKPDLPPLFKCEEKRNATPPCSRFV